VAPPYRDTGERGRGEGDCELTAIEFSKDDNAIVVGVNLAAKS
jgi:hypothetical protein